MKKTPVSYKTIPMFTTKHNYASFSEYVCGLVSKIRNIIKYG